ncbi:MAG: tRNA (guanosine(46)-N7)-methyltransferase TrmB [candidate division KSB1 bacterium]|nr:tRNA (guanosine(46)-N7)-methyltransferase TrmB [candidate division KSB1 bacterium]MDZ7275083.1 tRNA (guanosine(46)-N7)-methyltransferase TrmB [candidate division KSB1 bacterium]MDZ7286469.1 tRNA (guanosine(46)-N7)-methyltransferase TrmB [candidate division KSB1 bacterium]MDZ7299367.1 tRNA (guanosine(46)-N7)-methyltransferase TrmB [candidate division KSB1 bacterium]MDZ7306304.1 tRNA (guanosine(46)-N7)-methyltransferase TrmB [candidate division KSB1 bacterium]
MSRKKLRRFAELATFPNVYYHPVDLKGRWHERCFKNDHAITLELACGKGEYTIALARRFPQGNFIGVDAKGARLWTGAKIALQENLANAAFLRGQIENLAQFFAPQEVSEIWITFPDPFSENSKAKKRLTAPRFLQMYRLLLPPQGRIHLKTDDPGLFVFTLESVRAEGGTILTAIPDIHQHAGADELLRIQTTYERRHLAAGKSIKYVCFHLPPLQPVTD